MKHTILHVIDSLSKGGAEVLLVGTVNSMVSYNHIIVTMNSKNDFVNKINAKIISLNYKNKLDLLRVINELNTIIKSNDIKLIHSHLLTSTFITRLAKPKEVKLIFSVHNMLTFSSFRHSKVSWLIEKATYRKDHYSIFVSNEVMKDYDKSIGLKGDYSILHNYVENEFFEAAEKRKNNNQTEVIKLISVGNLKKQKNYEYLISSLANFNHPFSLDIYGEGPMRVSLEKLILGSGLEKEIRLMGTSDTIPDILPLYDICIMASTYEGFGISALEAMASGIPTLLSDIPVFREVAGQYSQFFEPHEESDLIEKLHQLINNSERREFLTRHGKKRAEQVSGKAQYMNKLHDIYYKNLGT